MRLPYHPQQPTIQYLYGLTHDGVLIGPLYLYTSLEDIHVSAYGQDESVDEESTKMMYLWLEGP